MNQHPSKFHRHHDHLHRSFGSDGFGRRAEAFARWFGTPAFLIGQTLVVAAWIVINVVAATSGRMALAKLSMTDWCRAQCRI